MSEKLQVRSGRNLSRWRLKSSEEKALAEGELDAGDGRSKGGREEDRDGKVERLKN